MKNPSLDGTSQGPARSDRDGPSGFHGRTGGDPHGTPEAIARLKRARLADRIARRVIALGGIGVLVAVLAIFAFVGAEAAPLLRGARSSPGRDLAAAGPALAVRVDEYRSIVCVANADGTIAARDAATGATRKSARFAGTEASPLAAVAAADRPAAFIGLTAAGGVSAVTLAPDVTYPSPGVRNVDVQLFAGDLLDAGVCAGATLLAARIVEEEKVVAVAATRDAAWLLRFKLGGDAVRVTPLTGVPLGGAAAVTCVGLAAPGESLRLFAGLADGRVVRWDASWPEDPELVESISTGTAAVTALATLLGDETLLVGTGDGSVSAWFGVRASKNAAAWNLSRIRSFERLGGAVARLEPAPRGKGFVALDATGAGYAGYSTTGRVVARIAAGDPVAAVAFAPKNDAVVALTANGAIREVIYDAPHPETTPETLFLPVWYESATEPSLTWQSTGPDEFEPKLSLTVLVFGTLKGVLYALLFSIPIAFAAAIYTALFLPARVRAMVKPAIEILAAVPSVVVGLIAALWLSPFVERHLVAVLSFLPAVALVLIGVFSGWSFLPRLARQRFGGGSGALLLGVAVVALAVAIAGLSASPLESAAFGGDLKAWCRTNLGLTYDPRNALVVGCAMGFAVIPVVFTIAEDAISNVPRSLWAASEALGATRWQTTWRVVVPAATPGLFAALMLGFGRAVGETMIVLMATGNTPILDLSPFNGMRTISACIAVEIPEAPHGGTLYRVLFLAGLLLFAFTFACNTAAEVIGQRLRKKYGRA